MSFRDLFTSPTPFFSGFQRDFDEADYMILGVPFDGTSTYRVGSRFAPLMIREASLNIETYSFRSGIDMEELKLHDAGDLHVTGDVNETLKRLEKVVREVSEDGKIPVLIGGEHTITLGAMRGFGKNIAILSFDAHLDLRDEYMGQTICHTTFMRRINESVKPMRIVEVGTRAVCREEVNYAKDNGIHYVTSMEIMDLGVKEAAEKIRELLDDYDRLYLTVDMDVLDPAYAPAVQNPEPEGLSTHVLLNLLSEICDRRIVAFDVVEVAPHYDTGITAIQAARIIFEVLLHIDKYRRKKGASRD